MKNNYKIGIVGLGYVGSAIKSFFEKKIQVFSYDIHKQKSTESSLKSLLKKEVDFLFICLPTPMNEDGSTYLNNINQTLHEIDSFGFNGVVVLKSTIPPKTSENFSKKYDSLSIIFNPEFLTEANFLEDFSNQKFIILGGEKLDCEKVSKLYEEFFKKDYIHITTSSEAETLKYFLNCFLAVKVSFSNEMYQLCNKLNIDYNKIVELVLLDQRIGKTHLKVPGPDGHYGFGGTCFPKDLVSLIKTFDINDVDAFILKAAWERNCKIDRKEKDWTKLKGRSVV